MHGIPSEMYGKDGMLSSWGRLVEKGDPEYGSRLFKILTNENILPKTYEGFRFLSLSANRGTRELGLIELVNNKLSETPLVVDDKPVFILNDICREAMETSSIHHENTKVIFVNSDAGRLPLSERSIDIMFDRMGAVWYKAQDLLDTAIKINGKIPGWQQEEIWGQMDAFLLDCRSRLRPEGCLLLDDPERLPDDAISTVGYLKVIYKNFPKKIEELGFSLKSVGTGEDRLAVLKKEDADILG